MDAAFSADWSRSRAKRELRDADERHAIRDVLRESYVMLKAVHRAYCRPFTVPLGAFVQWAEHSGILTPDAVSTSEARDAAIQANPQQYMPLVAPLARRLTRSQLQRLFMKVNYAHLQPTIRGKRNPVR